MQQFNSDLAGTSSTGDYGSLLKQRRDLDARLVQLREQAIADFKRRILAEAEELEIDVTSLFVADGDRRRVSRGAARVAFRDPANDDNTWSGRGRPPKWLQDYLDAGRDKDEFVVT